jgi:hypothetical protein
VTALGRLLAALIALIVIACSPPPATIKSAAPCEQAGFRLARLLDPNAHLVAAFVASVADVVSWESAAYGTGSMRIVSSSSTGAPLDRVDVCYYDGAFNIGGHPAGFTGPPYDRLLVTVTAGDGVAHVATAGFSKTMPLASPPHGP